MGATGPIAGYPPHLGEVDLGPHRVKRESEDLGDAGVECDLEHRAIRPRPSQQGAEALSALGWAGPCQFSGVTSLGRDLGSALNPAATERQLVRYTRVALVGLTVAMVVFALLRTEESAWWNVMVWTLRNGATLAQVLATFFWPLATRSAARCPGSTRASSSSACTRCGRV